MTPACVPLARSNCRGYNNVNRKFLHPGSEAIKRQFNSSIISIVILLVLMSCVPAPAPTPVPTNTPSATPPPTSTPTTTPSPTPTATITPTPSPSQIAKALGLLPDATFPRTYQIKEDKMIDQYGIVWAQIINGIWQPVTDANVKYQNIEVVKSTREDFITGKVDFDQVFYHNPDFEASRMYVTATGNFRDRYITDPTDVNRTITVTDLEVAFVDPISGQIRTTFVILCSPDYPGNKRIDTSIIIDNIYINGVEIESYDETKKLLLPGTQLHLYFMSKRSNRRLPKPECDTYFGVCTHEYWLNASNFFQNLEDLQKLKDSLKDPNASELAISPDLILSHTRIVILDKLPSNFGKPW